MKLRYIGYVKECSFVEKWGTPRQGGFAPSSEALLEFYDHQEWMEPIHSSNCPYIMILFHFHLVQFKKINQKKSSSSVIDSTDVNDNETNLKCGTNSNVRGENHSLIEHSKYHFTGVRRKIRPPKLNGLKIGCFASRSPHRPNPIGLSIVSVKGAKGPKTILVSGIDIVEGTPLVDVIPWNYDQHTISNISDFFIPVWLQNSLTVNTSPFKRVGNNEDPTISTESIRRTETDNGIGIKQNGKTINFHPKMLNVRIQNTKVYFSLAAFMDLYRPSMYKLVDPKWKPFRVSTIKCNVSEKNRELQNLITESLMLDPRSIHSQKCHRSGSFCIRLRKNVEVVYKHVDPSEACRNCSQLACLKIPLQDYKFQETLVLRVLFKHSLQPDIRPRSVEWLASIGYFMKM